MTDPLLKMRQDLGLSQSKMAQAMGLPTRTYEDIESGRSALRPIHMRAALYAALHHAVETKNFDLLNGDARDLALALAALVDPPKAG